MARKPGQRATYQDLMALPEHLVGELIDGELIASPRPAAPHGFAAWRMAGGLQPFDGPGGGGDRPGGWWFQLEPELHLHGEVLVPDVAGWRHERMPRLPNVAAFELPPDWVCEIASPSTAEVDRARKMPIYAREQVGWLWIVAPLDRTLEVFQLDGRAWKMVQVFGKNAAERIRAQPFDAIELQLERWWLPIE